MTVIRRRRGIDGQWTYDDPDEAIAASILHISFGVSLQVIDDWIDGAGKPFGSGDIERMLGWRARTIAAALRGDEDAAEFGGLFLMTLVHLNQREEFLLPLAQVGHDIGGKLHPGEMYRGYMPKMSDRKREARAARIVRARQQGVTQKEVAAREGVSVRTVARIERGRLTDT